MKTEKDNFSRLGQGIVGTGNSMARDLLTSFISPTDLVAKVFPRGRVIHTVWKRLNKDQQDLVKKAGVDGYSHFDISLVYILLRNVCTNLGQPTKTNLPAPIQGWGKDPTSNDLTPSDDMERLRTLRNAVYGHASEASISELEYQIHWKELKNIASRMKTYLGIDYVKELQDAEVYKMTDADIKQVTQEIRTRNEEMNLKLKESAREISTEVKKHTSALVHEHCEEMKELITKERKNIIKFLSGKAKDHKQCIKKLEKRLLEINDDLTKNIPLAPLEEDGDTMPVDLLYASVVITEDIKSLPLVNDLKRHTKSSKVVPSQTRREVTAPADIFEKNGERVKKIFLKGDAAHGKTTFCLWLVHKWYNAKKKIGNSIGNFDQWEKAMQEFDFVFLISFRNVKPNRSNAVEMICNDIFGMDKSCHDAINHILSSDEYKSLVIMDGLDEWNPNDEARKNLTCKDIPSIEGLSDGVVCFFSLRTWLFPRISKMKGDRNRVLEIHGLSENAIQKVVQNVLINHYGLMKQSVKFQETNRTILGILKDKNLKSFMKIPLLAVICVQLCYEEEDVGNSLTTFYINMLNMLIERAHLQHESTQNVSFQTASTTFPKVLTTKKCIMDCSTVLIKLGKVAYEGLLPNKRKLIFQERELKSEIGENEMQFAFDVGLISQSEARSLTTRNVSVTFFHKSIQEFLAAIFYVGQTDAIGQSISGILSDIDVVMEWSNVIMFICGLSPVLGASISQHVAYLSDTDVQICRYRESNEIMDRYSITFTNLENEESNSDCNKVETLYRDQAIWFRELQAGKIYIGELDRNVRFQVSDVVYFSDHNNEDGWSLTRYLMTEGYFDEIKSLYLGNLPFKEEGGVYHKFFQIFFSKATSLVKLILRPYTPASSIHKISIQSMKVLHLSGFSVCSTWFNKNTPLLSNLQNLHSLELSEMNHCELKLENTPFLTNMPHLNTLKLYNVTFGDITLENTPLLSNMSNLQTLELSIVTIGDVKLKNMPLFHGIPNLRNLDISDVAVRSISFENTNLLANMLNLHTFKFRDVTLGDTAFEFTPFLSNMPCLHTLTIADVSICGFNHENMPQLKNISSIHSLSLFGVWVGDIKLVNAPLLTNMPNLVSLTLATVTFGDISFVRKSLPVKAQNLDATHALNEKFSGFQIMNASLFSNMPKLDSVTLLRVTFGEIRLVNTPLLKNIRNLQDLTLSFLRSGDIRMINTPLLTNMPSLQNIELMNVTVGDIHLENTSLLTDLPNLQTLKLKKVNVGCICLENASFLTNLQNLHTLDLCDVTFGISKLERNRLMTNMPKLDTIKLSGLILSDVNFVGPVLDHDSFLSNIPRLRILDIKNINFKMKPLLTPEIYGLEKVVLDNYNLSVEGWGEFINSLSLILHCFEVILKNVEKSLKTLICQNSNFRVNRVRRIYKGRYIQRYASKYIGRYVYFGRYFDTIKQGCKGRMLTGKTRGCTSLKDGRNINKYVGRCVNSFEGRILYDLSIERV